MISNDGEQIPETSDDSLQIGPECRKEIGQAL